MGIFRRVSNLFVRSKIDEDISAELKSHIAMRMEDNLAAGMSPQEAQRDAMRRFGNPVVIRERTMAVEAALLLDAWWRDLRYAMRRLRKSPGFALTAVITLALGIGVNTAIFSVVEAVLLRPLPYRNPERLVVVWQTDVAHHASGAYFNSYREFEIWRQHSHSFEKLAALTWAADHSETLLWHDKPIQPVAFPASVDFFSMLGVSAQMGRTFEQADLRNGCTMVLAYPFWQEKLGAPGNIAGQSLMYGHAPCQVVGVMPKSFSFYPIQTDAWTLITPTSEYAQKPWEKMTGAFGLLKPGVTRDAAEAELTALQTRVLPEAPGELRVMRDWTPDVLDLQSNFTWLAGRNLRKGLWLLLGASGLILLMAAVNVGGLLLGRGMEREREMAVRAALGSGRRRLLAQALIESLLLGFCGTAAGVGLAIGLVRWFRAVNPVELPPGSDVTVDWRVLAFAAIAGLVSALAFGLYPAWRGSRINLNAALKTRGHAQSPAASPQRAARWLVVIQVALSMVLVTGAGLLAESLWKFTSAQLGYRTDHLFTARLDLPRGRYSDQGAQARLAASLETKLATLPGVKSVALGSNFVPAEGNSFSIEGDAATANGSVSVVAQSVSANFFTTMEIPLLRGRHFDTRDRQDTQPVAIVNQALARKYFPGTDPVGRAIKLSRADDPSKPWMTIVGIVGDVKTTTVFHEMAYEESPAVYRPLTQAAAVSLVLMAAEEGEPSALAGEIQQRTSEIDRDLILSDIGALETQHDAELKQPRFRALLFGGFAVLALVLALVGLYGVLTQLIARRGREIGIRMALGANRDRILRGILAQACAMTGAGIVIGAALASAELWLLRSLLYGIHAEGAGEFGCATVALLVVAVVAAWGPARRAASIDPMEALRAE
jgi:predicted permease